MHVVDVQIFDSSHYRQSMPCPLSRVFSLNKNQSFLVMCLFTATATEQPEEEVTSKYENTDNSIFDLNAIRAA